MAIRTYTDYYVACHYHNDTIPPTIVYGPYQDQAVAQQLAEALAKANYERYSVLERQFEYDDSWETNNNPAPPVP